MNYPSGWYVIADARRIRRRPVGLRRLGTDLVLWRDGEGRICGLPASCPHRGADLSLGRVKDGYLQCPYHGFRFDPNGTCVAVPCGGPGARIPSGLRARTLPIRVDHDLVWMWGGAAEATGPTPWFEGLGDDKSVVTVAGSFPCHLTRYMENALDVHHFAFVHRAVLPFVGSWIDMDLVESDGDAIRASGRLLANPGERLRRATAFTLEARMPTLVRVTVARIDLIAAVCPVDEGTTWVAARYYRPRLGRGMLARATSWIGAQADWQTAQRQDRRIVGSVRPSVGSPHVNVAVGADKAISLWYGQWLGAEQAGSGSEASASEMASV